MGLVNLPTSTIKMKQMSNKNRRCSRWWFQPIWKIWVKLEILPNYRGKNKKYLKPPPSFFCEGTKNRRSPDTDTSGFAHLLWLSPRCSGFAITNVDEHGKSCDRYFFRNKNIWTIDSPPANINKIGKICENICRLYFQSPMKTRKTGWRTDMRVMIQPGPRSGEKTRFGEEKTQPAQMPQKWKCQFWVGGGGAVRIRQKWILWMIWQINDGNLKSFSWICFNLLLGYLGWLKSLTYHLRKWYK